MKRKYEKIIDECKKCPDRHLEAQWCGREDCRIEHADFNFAGIKKRKFPYWCALKVIKDEA
jgi:hypothetical protein